MARTSLYLHFPGNAEEAFRFYRSVFQTEFVGPIVRFGDLPVQPGQPPWPAEQAKQVMNISLPILGGFVIMGNDAPEAMGQLIQGNNVTINLEPDTRAETDRLFAALQEGGKVEWAPAAMPWGAYWGSLIDRFGIEWMLTCTAQ
jgi:PhnB protein